MLKHEIITTIGELPVFFNHYSVKNQLIPSHWHQHVEILYIVKGSMEITTGHSTYVLHDKDFFIVNSSLIHQTIVRDTTEVILLQVPIAMFLHSLPNFEDFTFKAFISSKNHQSLSEYTMMVEYLYDMLKYYHSREAGYAFLFNSALQQFLYLLFKDGSNNRPDLTTTPKHLQYLRQAITYIDQHYARAISLKEISDHLALSQEYFCRMFKKNMGVTFLEYLNQIRLVQIHDDLMKTSHSVTYLQELHGFTNYKVFSRMFKASYGCTPSAIRLVQRTEKGDH